MFFSSRISPFTSTVILRDKSPRATAVATSAMLRTCAVRLTGHRVDVSVRSFHVPPTPGTTACTPSFPSVPTSRATRVTSAAKPLSWSTIVLIVFFNSRISPFTSTVILRDRSPRATAVVTSAMLRTCAVRLLRHRVHRVREILPRPAHARHVRLTAELAFGADLAGHARDFRGERRELLDHRIDRFFELENFAADVHGDLTGQVAAGHGGRDFDDVSHLRGEVGGHGIDVVGEVFPGSGDARHDRLAAELAFRPDLARDARDFRGERPELLDHRIDGLFQLKDFAPDVDGDLFRQVAVGDGDRHLGDIADLRRQVAGHLVDGVGEFFPHAARPFDLGLAAEFAFRADLARHARDFRREDANCSIILLTSFALRRNSPSSGRPSFSSAIAWLRSPLPTAPTARVTSVVGDARSSINVLSESISSAHPPDTPGTDNRCRSRPSLPTTREIRTISSARL